MMKKMIYGLLIIAFGMISFGTANASNMEAYDKQCGTLEIVEFNHGGYTWTYVYCDGVMIAYAVK